MPPLVRDAGERLGGLDIIVTAAAAIYRKPILEITDAEWDHMMALNLRGTFACATRRRASCGRMAPKGASS